MKREEAIKFWKFRYENAKDYTDPHWEAQERREHREYVEALQMAIEALQTAEINCVKCPHYHETEDDTGVHGHCGSHGRLIDADALMKELSDIQPYNWTESEAEIQEEADYSLFKSLINSAPTVQAEAVHKPDYSYEADMARRLREEALKNKLQELAQYDDYEMAHREADELLCDFITKLGYGEVAQKFDAVPKWYA